MCRAIGLCKTLLHARLTLIEALIEPDEPGSSGFLAKHQCVFDGSNWRSRKDLSQSFSIP
jgi:hypothetical protein